MNKLNITKTFCHALSALFCFSLTAQALYANQDDSEPPGAVELGNATYHGIEDGPVKLVNGAWEGEPYVEGGAARPRVGRLEEIHLTGDLDDDGNQEAAAILWESSAGSGSNTYLAAMARKDNGIVNTSTALIGDRVKFRRWHIADGIITIEVLQAGDNDAMCCPGMLATRTWSLVNKQLIEGEIEVTGRLSLAVLEGSHWVLTHMNHGAPLMEGAEITMTFVDGRMAGKSACNRYSGGIEDGDAAGEVKIGQTISTRMACPGELMKIEQEYLEALSQVSSFSFHLGSLALSGQRNDGTTFTMIYRESDLD